MNDANEKTMHSPEPWSVKLYPQSCLYADIVGATGEHVAGSEQSDTIACLIANAERAVACVNALAGIPDPLAAINQAKAALDIASTLLRESGHQPAAYVCEDALRALGSRP